MTVRVVSSGSGVAGVGSAQVVVPNVVGLTEAAAKAALTDFPFRVRTVETSGTPGTVFAQDPPAPAVRPRRSVVTIFLIVAATPDTDDILTALQGLKDSVDALETEQSAKDRNDAVLEQLEEIKKNLPPYGGSGSPGTSTTTSARTTGS
jgi:PASTA domain